MRRKTVPVVLAAIAAVTLSACTGPDGTKKGAAEASANYPVTMQNCGRELTIKAQPKRVVIAGNEALPLLDSVQAMDSVVARVADLPEGVYDAEVEQRIKKLPKVESKANNTGGSVVSTEVLLSQQPDLVIGADKTVDVAALESAGVQVYVPPAYCSVESEKMPAASYDRVYEQVTEYGNIFNAKDRATEVNAKLKDQVAGLSSGQAKGTAAALFLATDGGAVYAFGKASMVTPIFQAAGLSNVYSEEPQRVFEVSAEDLLGKDPERIVLLYSQGDAKQIVEQFSSSARNADLKAVKKKQVFAMPFAYTDPPSPLSVQGATRLAEAMN